MTCGLMRSLESYKYYRSDEGSDSRAEKLPSKHDEDILAREGPCLLEEAHDGQRSS